MLTLHIPSRPILNITDLVLDYNGTLAFEGRVKSGVFERLEQLAAIALRIHVITADTYGSVHEECNKPYIIIHVIAKEKQDEEKRRYIEHLGTQNCVAIGNGRNDALMLQSAAIGMALLQEEGLSFEALRHSDTLFKNINDALDALLHPSRLIATLRN
jgi:P-type E1-E2 ATPase